MEVNKYKILDGDFVGKGVSAQPNPMEKPEDEAKAVFDELVKDVVTPKFNAFVDAFQEIDLTADRDKPISTAMQEALEELDEKKMDREDGKVLTDNNFTDQQKADLQANTEARHSHGNKALLDKLTDQDIRNWNGANVLTKDNTTPWQPTGQYHPATKKYVDDKVVATGAADMTMAVYDPRGRKRDIFGYVDAMAEKVQQDLVMDFDNQLAWKGCAYSYTKAGDTYTEQWKKNGILQAEKISTRDADGNWTEVYKKYENGVKTEQVAVRSVKNADGGWTITVTEEVA